MSGVEFTLLRPLWLLALPALALLAWALGRRRGALGDWGRVVDPALLRALRALGRVDAGRGGLAGKPALALAALAVLALAGPAVERRDATAFRNLDGVVLVVDASPSLIEGADWPAFLTMARFGIAVLGARPAALVVFAGDAYVATDLTGDTRQLGQTLSLLEPGTVPDPGSRPERGLALARRILAEAGMLTGEVVLLSDGGGLGAAALAEAEALRNENASLTVIAAEAAGAQAAALAAAGGGRVFGLRDSAGFAAHIRAGARSRLVRQDYPLLFWSDLGRWLLLAALLPAALLFRRRAP
ncbi:vWA domain-containing protein [Roseivivax sp. CAU 1761]